MGTRGFDRGSVLLDCRLRCRSLNKLVAKNKRRTRNGCSLIQVAIQPKPHPGGLGLGAAKLGCHRFKADRSGERFIGWLESTRSVEAVPVRLKSRLSL